MQARPYKPQNDDYFFQLLHFLKELLEMCIELKLEPVIYGSLAYAFYTNDESIYINDIDILVPESAFSSLIERITKHSDLRYEETDYHSIKVFKYKAKITFDAMEEYSKDLPRDFVKVILNDIPLTIVSLNSLKEMYNRGKNTIPVKSAQYSTKLQRLDLLSD